MERTSAKWHMHRELESQENDNLFQVGVKSPGTYNGTSMCDSFLRVLGFSKK